MTPEEREGSLGPSLVGLQCAERSLIDFQRDERAGIRDAVAFYDDHLLIVRTPPNPGLGSLFKALVGNTASAVPHARIDRADIDAACIAREAPSHWRLMGDLEFLKLSTRQGEQWHWIDTASMDGKLTRLTELLDDYPYIRD